MYIFIPHHVYAYYLNIIHVHIYLFMLKTLKIHSIIIKLSITKHRAVEDHYRSVYPKK